MENKNQYLQLWVGLSKHFKSDAERLAVDCTSKVSEFKYKHLTYAFSMLSTLDVLKVMFSTKLSQNIYVEAICIGH